MSHPATLATYMSGLKWKQSNDYINVLTTWPTVKGGLKGGIDSQNFLNMTLWCHVGYS